MERGSRVFANSLDRANLNRRERPKSQYYINNFPYKMSFLVEKEEGRREVGGGGKKKKRDRQTDRQTEPETEHGRALTERVPSLTKCGIVQQLNETI